MVCTSYLAVTAAELPKASGVLAWMACRFDPKGKGLTNFPQALPPGSAIAVDDLHPIGQHLPVLALQQLRQLCNRLQPSCVVLDLQRPPNGRSMQMAKTLTQLSGTPVAVTPPYAKQLNCPVFLSAPLQTKLPQLIEPWLDREVWLDLCMGRQTLEAGQPIDSIPETGQAYQWDRFLCCGYIRHSRERFTLCRNKQMLPKILAEAGRLGIPKAFVLYSDL